MGGSRAEGPFWRKVDAISAGCDECGTLSPSRARSGAARPGASRRRGPPPRHRAAEQRCSSLLCPIYRICALGHHRGWRRCRLVTGCAAAPSREKGRVASSRRCDRSRSTRSWPASHPRPELHPQRRLDADRAVSGPQAQTAGGPPTRRPLVDGLVSVSVDRPARAVAAPSSVTNVRIECASVGRIRAILWRGPMRPPLSQDHVSFDWKLRVEQRVQNLLMRDMPFPRSYSDGVWVS